jgi:hypothetical protein
VMMLNSPMSFQRASGEDFQDDVDGINHLKERTSGPDFGRGIPYLFLPLVWPHGIIGHLD